MVVLVSHQGNKNEKKIKVSFQGQKNHQKFKNRNKITPCKV